MAPNGPATDHPHTPHSTTIFPGWPCVNTAHPGAQKGIPVRPGLHNFVKDMDKAWAAERPHEAIAAHFAEDGVLHDMTSPGPATGRAAIAEAMSAFTNAFSSMEFHSSVVTDDGETATVEWTVTGVHTGNLDGIAPTGNRIEVRGVNLLKCNPAGQLLEERSYWDSGTLLRQLGVFDN